jgi:hypothetical protein
MTSTAQKALASCPSNLIPDVLECITGERSFGSLLQKQQRLRAEYQVRLSSQEGNENETRLDKPFDGTAIFHCAHRCIGVRNQM